MAEPINDAQLTGYGKRQNIFALRRQEKELFIIERHG